jgi:Transposase DDE domain
MDIVTIFCEIDDFCHQFEPIFKQKLLTSQTRQRNRAMKLSLSEVMTIVVYFHISGYRNFKTYYLEQVCKTMAREFPNLVSYNRFVELMAQAAVPLSVYLESRKAECSGISFVDSTSIAVCHNRRIHAHKVFAGFARRGKTSVGWFYGFKLHIAINHLGELLAVRLTPGNIDDRKPLPSLVKRLWGQLFADKGYLSKELTEQLFERNIELITKVKKNMKERLMPLFDRLLLRKRAIVESVIDQLKNISNIEHSRHRSVTNFLVNVLAGLTAYTFREKKPSLNIQIKEIALLST